MKLYLKEEIRGLTIKTRTIRYDLDTPKAPQDSDKNGSWGSSLVLSNRTFCNDKKKKSSRSVLPNMLASRYMRWLSI